MQLLSDRTRRNLRYDIGRAAHLVAQAVDHLHYLERRWHIHQMHKREARK